MTKLFTLMYFLGTLQTPDTSSNIPYVAVANGGGFTNQWSFYRLTRTGELYAKSGLNQAYIKTADLPEETVNKIFEMAGPIATISHNHPANTSKVIEYYDGRKKNRLVWTSAKDDLNVLTLEKFYKDFKLLISPHLKE